MDITWLIGIGGVSLVAILQHIKIESDINHDKLKIEAHKLYGMIQDNEIIELKLIANRHLTELEWLRKDYVILKREQARVKAEPPPKYKEDLQQPIFQKIFKKGRKALLLETHPDHGGTREAMEEVEAAFEVLKEIKPVVDEKRSMSYRDFIRDQQSGLGGFGQQSQATWFAQQSAMFNRNGHW